MSSPNRSVEQTVRDHIHRGQILLSPGRGYPPHSQEEFTVLEVADTGIKVSKLAQAIRFGVLDTVICDMRNAGGTVLIGGAQGWAKLGTFERFIQDAVGDQTRRSTYVAPILVECGISEYVPEPGAKRIRLTPQYMENTP